MQHMELNGFDHFLFFVICIVLPGMSLLSARSEVAGIKPLLPAKKHIYFSNGLMLWIGALLVLTNWNISDKGWTLLGIQYPYIDNVVNGMIGVLVFIYAVDTIYNIINADKKEEESGVMEQILPENWGEYLPFIFLAVSAGICEEVVYRGFLVNYFLQITSSTGYAYFLSLILPSIFFAVGHIYQGWVNVVKIFSLSLLFCGIFLFSKSLLLVIVIHVLVDLISGAIVVILNRRKKQLKS